MQAAAPEISALPSDLLILAHNPQEGLSLTPPAEARQMERVTGTGQEGDEPGGSITTEKLVSDPARAEGTQALTVGPAGGSGQTKSDGVRMTHPENGRFDVVVVQTDVADIAPVPKATLAGQPVYTVYLSVGDAREWILHFCAADARTMQNGSVVTLGDPRPLAPPYPRVTILPSHIPSSDTKVLLVHGMIDETGAMRNLRILGAPEDLPYSDALLTALAQWQFRPAKRGVDATSVEVLLAVPTQSI